MAPPNSSLSRLVVARLRQQRPRPVLPAAPPCSPLPAAEINQCVEFATCNMYLILVAGHAHALITKSHNVDHNIENNCGSRPLSRSRGPDSRCSFLTDARTVAAATAVSSYPSRRHADKHPGESSNFKFRKDDRVRSCGVGATIGKQEPGDTTNFLIAAIVENWLAESDKMYLSTSIHNLILVLALEKNSTFTGLGLSVCHEDSNLHGSSIPSSHHWAHQS